MKEEIKLQLESLVGSKLNNIGRASNLFWIELGERLSAIRRGRTIELSEYALNIHCSWRITNENKIVVASGDIYSPHSDWNVDIEDFDWDVQGNNKFDEKIEYLMRSIQEPLTVEKIDSDEIGGLTIFLSKGFRLHVFPDISGDDECSEFWRFFTRGKDSFHFVVTANGIEKDFN
ncbi:hypothetical protein [Priestia megaterium]|uniref:hypothetical protein n=1 Tax=Priestia megaterium TaxID=1404 RepID=UPI0013E3B01C|nr:hypothetical protein [Priestia megaterium]MED3863220.1 hypothetical protein [Priestia megaterium]MED4101828.1 hypothetical protein [Priestia megaterium]MED4142083.1 hypothetical protein [Priestia megaterium]MED4166571.1 hypothetical protein [Priestia megaterium]MED4202022.1 hypothetical protein [Priestia megaterium]